MKSLGGFALFASAFGVTVAMLVQNVGEFTDPSVATSAASTTSSDTVQSRGPVVLGADPLGDTQIVVRMAPFTNPLAAQQLGEEYGLHMVGSSPSFGRYVFDLPTIDVAAGPTSDTRRTHSRAWERRSSFRFRGREGASVFVIPSAARDLLLIG